jgi:sporulation protein YlmC with PRC-barrel domain
MSSTDEPDRVAWTALDAGALVVAADGSEVGRVKEVVGDEEADIFDGLVVTHSRRGSSHYIASERVTGIWPDRVQTDMTPGEAESLPSYEEPKVTTWHADEGGRLRDRLRRATRDLFGGRRR